jgi:hypothetical protein
MNRKASIGAEITLDRRGFSKSLAAASSDARREVQGMSNISGNFAGLRSGIERVGKAYGGLRGLVGDVVDLVKSPLAANNAYADLKDNLTAVEGSADSARVSLGFLRGVAEEQALEFAPLVEAQARLVSIGNSASESREMIRELANAAELSGADGAQVVTALASTFEKVSEKGSTSLKALMSFGDTLPILRQILAQQFGVKTAADLEKLDLTSGEVFDGLLTGLKQIDTASASTGEKLANAENWLKNITGADEAATALDPRTPAPLEDAGQRNQRIARFQSRAADEKTAADMAKSAPDRQASAEDLELSTLRARGKTKQADALQTKIDQRRSTEAFTAQGYDPTTAAAMASQQTQNKEDTAYFEKTGKRKIRAGGKASTGFTGLDGAFDNYSISDEDFTQKGMMERSTPMAKLQSKQGKDDTRFEQGAGRSMGKDSGTAATTEDIQTLNRELRAMHNTIKGQNPSVSSKTAPST